MQQPRWSQLVSKKFSKEKVDHTGRAWIRQEENDNVLFTLLHWTPTHGVCLHEWNFPKLVPNKWEVNPDCFRKTDWMAQLHEKMTIALPAEECLPKTGEVKPCEPFLTVYRHFQHSIVATYQTTTNCILWSTERNRSCWVSVERADNDENSVWWALCLKRGSVFWVLIRDKLGWWV